jgi:hypothetical protein
VTFIDWSDAEGMFGLLLDFVADESSECRNDPERLRFLSDLSAKLRIVESQISEIPVSVVLQRLRDIQESVGPEFANDPVMLHLEDCIEEVQRVDGGIV